RSVIKRRFHLSQSASIDVAALDLQAAGDEFYAGVAALRRRNRGINLHDRPCSAMALTMRCGVIGDTNNSAPSGRSASFTALAMAAGGGGAPPPPPPLPPAFPLGGSGPPSVVTPRGRLRHAAR